jgi:hypothetical protein
MLHFSSPLGFGTAKVFAQEEIIMANTPATRNPQEQRTTPGPTFGEIKDKAHDLAGTVSDKARETTSAIADKARDAASTMADRSREAASAVGQKMSDAACSVGHKAEDATHSVGHGMQSLAGSIREKMPQSGMMASAGGAVADTLERGGKYLEQEGLSGIGKDLTDVVRRNPIPALLIAVGVGFLIARSTTRS